MLNPHLQSCSAARGCAHDNLTCEALPDAQELGLLVAYADGEASQAKAAAEEKAVADATSEFERALQLLQDLKAAGGSPKAALKQASVGRPM